MGVEADDVDGGGGVGVLEAGLGQAAVAGPAQAGDVEGLVDGALDPGAEAVVKTSDGVSRSSRDA